MNEEAGFLETLEANPSNETARGAYADWLEERGRTEEAERHRSILTHPEWRELVALGRLPMRGSARTDKTVVKNDDGFEWSWWGGGARWAADGAGYLPYPVRSELLNNFPGHGGSWAPTFDAAMTAAVEALDRQSLRLRAMFASEAARHRALRKTASTSS